MRLETLLLFFRTDILGYATRAMMVTHGVSVTLSVVSHVAISRTCYSIGAEICCALELATGS